MKSEKGRETIAVIPNLFQRKYSPQLSTFAERVSKAICIAESIRLPYYCSVFQTVAIQAAVKIIWDWNITVV